MPKTEFWSNTSTKLGVISGALGIILSGVAAFKIFKPGNVERTANLESIHKQKKLEAKIEVAYVIIDPSIYGRGGDSVEKESVYFLDYPLLKNEIASEKTYEDIKSAEVFEDSGSNRVTYLVLQNNGIVTPEDVQIVLKRFKILDKIAIEETPGIASNYETTIRRGMLDSTIRIFRPPTQFETGKGLLIPLFVSSHSDSAPKAGKRSWRIISKVVYIPELLIYTDPLTGVTKKIKIRAMRDPTLITDGVEDRG